MQGNPLLYFMLMVVIGIIIFAGINIQAENQIDFDENGTINGTDTEMEELKDYKEQTATMTGIEVNVLWAVMIILIAFMIIATYHYLFGRRSY